MQAAFSIIIAVVGAIYALATRQAKIALGFLIMAISFVLVIPGLVYGIWVDVLSALSMIIFAVSLFIIVFKKKAKEVEPTQEQEKND